MVHKAEEENKKHDHGIVDAEVTEVALEARGEIAETVRYRVGGRVSQELAPGAAHGEERLGTRFGSEEDSGTAAAAGAIIWR